MLVHRTTEQRNVKCKYYISANQPKRVQMSANVCAHLRSRPLKFTERNWAQICALVCARLCLFALVCVRFALWAQLGANLLWWCLVALVCAHWRSFALILRHIKYLNWAQNNLRSIALRVLGATGSIFARLSANKRKRAQLCAFITYILIFCA